jgi:hypothetical protein
MSNITPRDLAQFTGTTQWFRHGLMRQVLYTEGVQYLAEQAGAYWLIDKVATLQLEPKISAEGFQVWKLRVADDTATLTCEDGNDNTVYREAIGFTDFPLAEIDLWFEDNVIMLPSER